MAALVPALVAGVAEDDGVPRWAVAARAVLAEGELLAAAVDFLFDEGRLG